MKKKDVTTVRGKGGIVRKSFESECSGEQRGKKGIGEEGEREVLEEGSLKERGLEVLKEKQPYEKSI